MKAIDRPFTKIINGSTQFVIPVFQRDYRWTESQCEQLWQDVLQIAGDAHRAGHFLGSVVYVATGDSAAGFTRWLLIDGQQRVTTLTLLLTALRDHIRESNWVGGEDSPTAKRVEAYFLKNTEEEGQRNHKLVLRRHDEATLAALLDSDELPAHPSERVIENYEYFKEQLKLSNPDMVYRGIDRLVVVDVTLDRGRDDPQLIFESLNSTGIDLSQSDLIRNFILMRLPEAEQTRLYEAYWCKIEHLFRGSEKTFDAFIRDFMALDSQATKQERADSIYFAFRRQYDAVGDNPDQLSGLLERLLRFAGYHAAFSIGTERSTPASAALTRLRHLVDAPATLAMRLAQCRNELGTLTDAEFVEAIELIESFVFRRAVCGEQTRGYWQVFANLAYSISDDEPLPSLRVGLARLRDNARYPSNTEFRRALEERDLYGKRICLDLLDRLENHDSLEQTDTSSYSIEHIMPQNENLNKEWREMLGDDWRTIQSEWLHRLGNLTLTGYNSAYSDKPFEKKKTIKGGFRDSSVRLNRSVREATAWTAEEMEARGKDLAERAVKIWSELVVDQQLIAAAEEDEMRRLAERRDVEKVAMSPLARPLFNLVSDRVCALSDDIIELAERHSVSYHGPSFFMELLPRNNRVTLLLALDFNEIDDPNDVAKDATERKFFVNAQYEGGVNIPIWKESDLDHAMPIVKQAFELARS